MERSLSKNEICKSSTISINHFKLKIPPAFIPDKWVCNHKHKHTPQLDNKRPKSVKKINQNQLSKPRKSLPLIKNEMNNYEILQTRQENNFIKPNDCENNQEVAVKENYEDVKEKCLKNDLNLNKNKIHVSFLNIEQNGFMNNQYSIKKKSKKKFKYIGFDNFQEFFYKNVRKFRKKYLKNKNSTLERHRKRKKKNFKKSDNSIKIIDKYFNESLKTSKKNFHKQKKRSKKKYLKKSFRRKLNYLFKNSFKKINNVNKTNQAFDSEQFHKNISLYNSKRILKYFCLNFNNELRKNGSDICLNEKK